MYKVHSDCSAQFPPPLGASLDTQTQINNGYTKTFPYVRFCPYWYQKLWNVLLTEHYIELQTCLLYCTVLHVKAPSSSNYSLRVTPHDHYLSFNLTSTAKQSCLSLACLTGISNPESATAAVPQWWTRTMGRRASLQYSYLKTTTTKKTSQHEFVILIFKDLMIHSTHDLIQSTIFFTIWFNHNFKNQNKTNYPYLLI